MNHVMQPAALRLCQHCVIVSVIPLEPSYCVIGQLFQFSLPYPGADVPVFAARDTVSSDISSAAKLEANGDVAFSRSSDATMYVKGRQMRKKTRLITICVNDSITPASTSVLYHGRAHTHTHNGSRQSCCVIAMTGRAPSFHDAAAHTQFTNFM